MTMGTVTVRAQHELSAITATGNTTPHTVEFQNAETSLVTTGNVSVGKDLTVTGNVAVDTDTLFVDSVNDRVGIGTANPKSNFHVGVETASLRIGAVNYSGSAADTSTYGLERSRNQILFSTWRDAQTDKIGAKICGINKQTYSLVPTALHLIQSTDLAFYTVPPGTGNYDDTLERLRITDVGNVGIGTTSPSQKLDVNGVIKSNVPSWGVHQLGTQSGSLKFTNRHVTEQNCTVTLSTGSPARTRVTATVAGRYFVTFVAFTEFSVAANTANQMALLKNGATYSRSYHVQPMTNYNSTSGAISSSYSVTCGMSIVVDLLVDDYLEMSSDVALHYNSNGYFSGFLIG